MMKTNRSSWVRETTCQMRTGVERIYSYRFLGKLLLRSNRLLMQNMSVDSGNLREVRFSYPVGPIIYKGHLVATSSAERAAKSPPPRGQATSHPLSPTPHPYQPNYCIANKAGCTPALLPHPAVCPHTLLPFPGDSELVAFPMHNTCC